MFFNKLFTQEKKRKVGKKEEFVYKLTPNYAPVVGKDDNGKNELSVSSAIKRVVPCSCKIKEVDFYD